jgi:hypothetical protein
VLRFPEAGGTVQRVASSWQGFLETGFQAVELPDGRVLLPSRVYGRDRLLAASPGKDPAPLLVEKETTMPAAVMVGKDGPRLAFVAGSGKKRHLTVAVLDDHGNVIKRQPIEDVPGEGLGGLAASPDGNTLYYIAVQGGDGQGGQKHPRRVWAVPADGGKPSRFVAEGDGVAVHPASGDLVVYRREQKGVGLYRVAPEGGTPRKITARRAIDDKGRLLDLEGLRLAPAGGFSGRAIDNNGRVLVTTATKKSWFWGVAVFDPEKGTLSPIPVDFEGDLYLPSWGKDGQVFAMGYSYKSEMWRLTPRK